MGVSCIHLCVNRDLWQALENTVRLSGSVKYAQFQQNVLGEILDLLSICWLLKKDLVLVSYMAALTYQIQSVTAVNAIMCMFKIV